MNDFTFLISQYIDTADRLLQYVGGRRTVFEYRYSDFWDGDTSTDFRNTILSYLSELAGIRQRIDSYILKYGDTKKPKDTFLSASKGIYVKGADNEPYDIIYIEKYMPIDMGIYEKFNNAMDIVHDIDSILVAWRYEE